MKRKYIRWQQARTHPHQSKFRRSKVRRVIYGRGGFTSLKPTGTSSAWVQAGEPHGIMSSRTDFKVVTVGMDGRIKKCRGASTGYEGLQGTTNVSDMPCRENSSPVDISTWLPYDTPAWHCRVRYVDAPTLHFSVSFIFCHLHNGIYRHDFKNTSNS